MENKKVLAKCLKTYPDEDDMIDFSKGEKEVNEVKIYFKGRKYFVTPQLVDLHYYEIIKPIIYEK